MSVKVDYNILNQKGTPAFFSDVLANRPAFGFAGRVFISTDSGQIFEDTGTAWNLIADAGVGGGTLSSVCVNGNTTATGIVITAGGLSTNSLTDTTLTSGSVLFATSGGAISQDNTNLFWDNTNKWLGIGTAPSSPLDIHNAGSASMLALNNTGGNASNIIFLNASANKWRIGNTASNTFDLFNNQIGTTALSFSGSNSAATFINSVTATAHITTGGTSSQFVKGNGTLDSSAYITLANLSATTPLSYNNSTGAFTILQSGASQSGYLSSTDWNTFNNKASLSSLSATTPLSYNSSTGAFTIQVANSGQSGYLTSTDWNTFNNKQATLTFGNLTEAVSSVLSITGGTNAVIGTGTTIQIKQSSASQSGYLSSTDWTTFNNKASALNGTGFVKASGTTITYDNSTYYLASNPNNYIALTGLSATSPLSYNNTSGGFSISQATTSANGYLSSTDWNTFNNKQSALTNPVTGTGTTNYLPKFTGTSTIGNSAITDDGTTVTLVSRALSGTSASFSGDVVLGASSTPYIQNNIYLRGRNSANTAYKAIIGIGGSGSSAPDKVFIDPDNNGSYFGGAATFSSSVKIGAGLNVTGYTNSSGANNWEIGSDSSGYYINAINRSSGNYNQPAYIDAQKLIINSGSGGNVGIGTSSPSALLHIAATGSDPVLISNSGASSYNSLILSNNNNYKISIGIGGGSVGGNLQDNGYIGTISNRDLLINTNNTERMRITSGGNVLIGTTTDNGQGRLQNTGQSFTGGLGIGGLTFSTNTTASVNTSFYFFNGGAGVSLTLPDTNGQSMIYYIKNYSASPLTIARTGSNTFIAAGTITTVTSLTLATGVSTTIIGNGTSNYIQLN